MQVAVKTVAFHTRAGERPQERAIAEAAITFALAHENVVATYSHEFKPLQIAPWGVVEASTIGRGGVRGGNGNSRTAPQNRGGPAAVRDTDAWNLFTVQDWKLFLVQVRAGSCRLLPTVVQGTESFVCMLGTVCFSFPCFSIVSLCLLPIYLPGSSSSTVHLIHACRSFARRGHCGRLSRLECSTMQTATWSWCSPPPRPSLLCSGSYINLFREYVRCI